MAPKDIVTEVEQPQEWTPRFDREVRFAVVMYGGISLAIYIYGVAQELYNLVRATATQNKDRKYLYEWDQLTQVQKAYRRLGRKLRARFIVDILSGTSAGGINAVYLAKALVNNQDFGQLRNVWVEEGDIERLINDKGSRHDLSGLKVQATPTSLMNSQRMYYKLLEAMDRMDASPRMEGFQSPYVNELDLFITASDIRGLPLRLRLPGDVPGGPVEEYRHRAVFRFHYSTKEAAGDATNDFLLEDNPFLAFTARTTSAIPPAFEPSRLDDIEAVLNTAAFHGRYLYNPTIWAKFYRDYRQEGEDFPSRAFGDGGYLDNKPFSYITEALLRRRADLPVDRKLVYVEPAPEHIESAGGESPRPDVIENVTAALITLPRYESIREDIRVVEERNHIIEQMNLVVEHSQEATIAFLRDKWGKNQKKWQTNGLSFAKTYLEETIRVYGPGYALYHNLRVADVLDNYAEAVSRALGWDGFGDLSAALRQLMNAWRVRYFELQKTNKRSESDLVFNLDMSWRFRRLYFMQNLIDVLMAGLSESETGAALERKRKRAEDFIRVTVEGSLAGKRKAGLKDWELPSPGTDVAGRMRKILQWHKHYFNNVQVELRVKGRVMRKRGLVEDKEFPAPGLKDYATALLKLQKKKAELLACKGQVENSEKWESLTQVADAIYSALTDHSGKQRGYLYRALDESSVQCRAPLKVADREGKIPSDPRPKDWVDSVSESVLQFLGFYFNRYEYFDMITFPVQYGTPVGESDVVEVVRVSPEDATSILDERREGRKKLAGTKLANFGAFFVREWRENDILWGRLDGAERLVTALWPAGIQEEERKAILSDLQKAILVEDLRPKLTKELQASLNAGGEEPSVFNVPKKSNAVKEEKQPASIPPELRRLTADKVMLETTRAKIKKTSLSKPGRESALQSLDAAIVALESQIESFKDNRSSESPHADAPLQKLEQARVNADALMDYFKNVYRVRPDFPPQETVRNAARGTAVVGKLFQGLADTYQFLGKPGALLARLGQYAWGVMEVAVPYSLPNIFFKHWLKIVYAFEVFLIVFGALLGFNNTVMRFGVGALLATLAANLVIHYAGWLIEGSGLARKLIKGTVMLGAALVLLALLVLIYFGLVQLGFLEIPGGLLGDWIKGLLPPPAPALDCESLLKAIIPACK